MNTCPNCSAELRPGDNFCLNCGYRLVTPPPPPSQNVAPQIDSTLLGNSASYGFTGANEKTIAGPAPVVPASSAVPVANTIERPAHLSIALNNSNSMQQYPLNQPETTIGRAPNNDLVLAEDRDKLISRYHATIRYENGIYTLRDNSANGTILNDQSIEKQVNQPLHDGDKIVIGAYTLIFYAPTSVADAHTMIGSIPDLSRAMPPAAGDAGRSIDWQSNGALSVNLPPAPPAPAASNYAPGAIPPPVQPPPPPAQLEAQMATPAISLHRFTQLAQPSPDFAALWDAAAALNGQITSLQQQLTTAQSTLQGHESELTNATDQLRTELRQVTNRINEAATAMATNRDEVGMDRLTYLAQDVMRNPRDIDNARAFADQAPLVNKLIQQYGTALKILQACGAQLNALIGTQE